MKYSKFIVKPDKNFSFDDFDPDYTGDFKNEEEAEKEIEKETAELEKFVDILRKHEKFGLLLIFQGMDGAGKDPLIKQILSNGDPQGFVTKKFGAPTENEQKQDYLRRAFKSLPARGQIGIFNRSYYEHAVTDRAHPEKLDKWTMPDELIDKGIWKRIYQEVNNFEEYLTNNGIHVLKFFLFMSKDKQRDRLLERINKKEKRSGFSMNDIEDRKLWDKFMKFYEETIRNTSSDYAPWYVIPANQRWFTQAAVASIIVDKLKSFHKDYPKLNKEEKEMLRKGKEMLESEEKDKKKSKK